MKDIAITINFSGKKFDEAMGETKDIKLAMRQVDHEFKAIRKEIKRILEGGTPLVVK
jgi:hypothetical protein